MKLLLNSDNDWQRELQFNENCIIQENSEETELTFSVPRMDMREQRRGCLRWHWATEERWSKIRQNPPFKIHFSGGVQNPFRGRGLIVVEKFHDSIEQYLIVYDWSMLSIMKCNTRDFNQSIISFHFKLVHKVIMEPLYDDIGAIG